AGTLTITRGATTLNTAGTLTITRGATTLNTAGTLTITRGATTLNTAAVIRAVIVLPDYLNCRFCGRLGCRYNCGSPCGEDKRAADAGRADKAGNFPPNNGSHNNAKIA
ncbi:hypothetical protein ACFVRB_08300, partial [Streptomyces nojiriensis]|uniref:hypothetical protein n=1 Tax=Streptomyces nojiriensis TaxID=66374 RepID=UPI0036DA2E1D